LPPDVLARMERDARIEVYDRENDVAIARGRQDQVRLRAAALRRELGELDEQGKRIAARLRKAGGGRAEKYERPLNSHRAFIEAQLRLADAARATAEIGVDGAVARLEQTRQRQLVRTGRAVAVTLQPFDA